MSTATTTDKRSRLRLVVIQALVFSLFATLLVRLWYIQVASGDEYSAQAASQSVREVVVQPPRGLVVDDQGRPLVTNRTSWVVSLMSSSRGRGRRATRTIRPRSAARRPGGSVPRRGRRPERDRSSWCRPAKVTNCFLTNHEGSPWLTRSSVPGIARHRSRSRR